MREGAVVSFKDRSANVSTVDIGLADAGVLAQSSPWRVFRWRHGQAHYSGWYWASTTGSHVVYESRLELARLLLADFDHSVVAIAAQPFCVSARVGGRERRHVPDFLLVEADGGVTVVNVKPASQLELPKVAEALGWAGKLFADKGWRHEVWSGTCAVVLSNVRFLAAYRRGDRVDADAVAAIERETTGVTNIGEVEARFANSFGVEASRPALLHLIWQGVLRARLDAPLSASTVLERAA
jgi:TnsA-like endonuclease N terminal